MRSRNAARRSPRPCDPSSLVHPTCWDRRQAPAETWSIMHRYARSFASNGDWRTGFFYQAASLEWIIQAYGLSHHLLLHSFHNGLTLNFECIYNAKPKNSCLRWMVLPHRCKDLYFVLWSVWGIRAYVPADDFLSWPHVCDRKGETALSEVTQWLLGPAGGQMTLKCFVYLSTAATTLWTCWPEV